MANEKAKQASADFDLNIFRNSKGSTRLILRAEGDGHKQAFVDLLAEKVPKYHMRLFAYCLMDNHYHLDEISTEIELCWRLLIKNEN